MLKRFLPVLLLPLMVAGCTTTFTNLTPQQQTRNTNNVYTVEVALKSTQQTLRWDSIRPQILVGTTSYPMHPTPLMTNRWEGAIPVPSTTDTVSYRYRFDYDYNSFGKPKTDNMLSSEYTLKIRPEKK
jgi:hypothetical protein